MVPAHRLATVLPALRHDLLAGLSALEVLDAALSRGEHPAALPGRLALLAVVAPTPTARGLAGGGHFCASSGHGRIGGLDHRTQESALTGSLPRCTAGLRTVCALRAAGDRGPLPSDRTG